MGDDASNLREVGARIVFDFDEIQNTGTFRAELELPEGTYCRVPETARMRLAFGKRTVRDASPSTRFVHHGSVWKFGLARREREVKVAKIKRDLDQYLTVTSSAATTAAS